MMSLCARGRMVAVVVIGGAIGLSGALGGCHNNTTYPEVPTARGFTENPNTPSGEQAMVASLQYVASRWAPGKREYDSAETPGGVPMVPYDMVVNLPVGTRKKFYDRIPAQIGPNVHAATPESVQSGLPVMHVARMWLRFNTGTVDVIRPVAELGAGPDGQPIYQKVTLTLKREFGKEWRVVYGRTWSPGDDAPPEIYYVPEVDSPNQHTICMREAEARYAAEMGTPVENVEPTLGAVDERQSDAQ